MRSYLIFVLGLWAALVVGFAAPAQVVSTEVWVLLFAESLLPLVNAVFDYLSYGITLGLIQVGRMEYSWLIWALLSTLVPTLVHLVLLFLSAFTWVPHRFKM